MLDEVATSTGGALLDVLAKRLRTEEGASSGVEVFRSSANSPEVLFEVARVLTRSRDGVPADLKVDPGMAAARRAVTTARSLDDAKQQVVQLLEPITPELRLALAERAIAEGDDQSARADLDRALSAGAAGAVSAETRERLAEVGQRLGDLPEACRQLVAAAEAWTNVSRGDRALKVAEAAVALDAENAEARAWVASSLIDLNSAAAGGDADSPKRAQDAQLHLRRALEVLESAEALLRATPAENSTWLLVWVLQLRGWLLDRLADLSGELVVEQRWQAMQAVQEALALQPASANGWQGVANVSYSLGLWSMAELSAREAARLEPTSRAALAQHVRALINRGDHIEALKLLGDAASSFEWSMKAHVLLRQNDAEGAVRVFSEHPPEADAPWARLSHCSALMLTGRTREALTEAREFDSWLRPRSRQSLNRDVAARTSLLIGDDRRAETLAERVRAQGLHSADLELAVLAATRGDLSVASLLVADFCGDFTSKDEVQSWENVDRPLFEAALEARGAHLPDLALALDRVARLRDVLDARRDPLYELEQVAAAAPQTADTAAVLELGPLTVALARQDRGAVQQWLAAQEDNQQSLVRKSLEEWILKRRALENAAEIVAAAAAGQITEAIDGLRHLLLDWPLSADDFLRTASPQGIPAQLLDALASLTDDPEVGSTASFVSQWLGGGPGRRDYESATHEGVEVLLPASWFVQYSDPVAEHPLFLRHLHEMRLLGGDSLPPVRVVADLEMEPNRYQVLVRDRAIEEGAIPIGQRFLPREALDLVPEVGHAPISEARFPDRLGTVAVTDSDPDPDPDSDSDSDSARTSLVDLLSKSVLEVLVGRIERVSTRAFPAEPA
ncbi:hypothetical protein [Nocardioides pinisoli]|uniref:Tetratricopeptide repeat protein n=1 Tax=Nocardioides pinisoli TaxID=2950279 RepID=A0ABT1KS53_9ACTN|nr:hypothetical protein [Nocardioides pinisoli]MCP3420573.1 hypothetical protein [Nocardioides pinisoli]